MFEAKLSEGIVLKKILDAIKDLLNEATFECSDAGLQLQAMDNSHVSLVSMHLKADSFDEYRCDRNQCMGMNLSSLSKILKCSSNDDAITIKAQDSADIVSFIFESKKGDRVSDFDMKLMSIDSEHLGIPNTEYSCIIQMSSSEFARIVRDLGQFGDSIMIECSKRAVTFSCAGDVGTGKVKLKPGEGTDLVKIEMDDPASIVNLTFAARYLTSFAKASGLSERVTLSMSEDVPLVVEFKVATNVNDDYGYIRYYLAPKITDGDDWI